MLQHSLFLQLIFFFFCLFIHTLQFCDTEYLDVYETYRIITDVKPDVVHAWYVIPSSLLCLPLFFSFFFFLFCVFPLLKLTYSAPTWICFSVMFWCWWKSIPAILCYHTHVPEYVRVHFLCIFIIDSLFLSLLI